VLRTIEELSRDAATRRKIIDGIRAGGSPEARMSRAEDAGVLSSYASEDDRLAARKALIGGHWGDPRTVLAISDALATALERVTDEKPLRTWWAAGATQGEISASVHEGADAVYLTLLTRPLGDIVVLEKFFDRTFKLELIRQAEEFDAFTQRLEG
jgi:hypothetical protein